MVLGEKRRRIEQLEGQVHHFDTELTNIQPWIGLAQTIRSAAAEHAATLGLDTAIGLAVHRIAKD